MTMLPGCFIEPLERQPDHMHPTQIQLVRDSFRVLRGSSTSRGVVARIFGGAVAGRVDLADAFFAEFFRAEPAMQDRFPADALQRDQDLMSSLDVLVRNLGHLESIAPLLEDTGARAQEAGAEPRHFGAARDAMLCALSVTLSDGLTPELQDAWTEALNAANSVMLRGAGRARLRAA
jgi:hemoglobin-like flavoprotein